MPKGQTPKGLAPPLCEPRSGRSAALLAAVVAAVGIAATLALFFAARQAEWATFDAEFARNANREANAVERKMERAIFAVQAFQQIVVAHGGVDAQAFAAFAQPFLSDQSDLTAMQWVSYVTDAGRDATEADNRHLISPHFRIVERDRSGALVPAQRRSDYFPALYVATRNPEAAPLVGYDFGSTGERRSLYQRAIKNGALMVSPPTDPSLRTEHSVLVVAPVFRSGMPTTTPHQRQQALLGFVAAIYDAHELLSQVLDSDEFRLLALTVEQSSAHDAESTAEVSMPGQRQHLGWPRWMLPRTQTHSAPLQFGGTEWVLHIAATPQYLSHYLPLFHWLVLPIGLLVVSLSAGTVWMLLRGRDHLEAMVEIRTRELAANGEAMAGILGAMDIAADGIVIISADDRLTYANRALMDTTGVTEVVGLGVDEFFCDRTGLLSRDQIDAICDEVRRSESWKGELTLPHAEPARCKHLLGHIRGLPDGARVMVISDLSETRRRDEEQRRLERQLEEARKLEVLGTLAAGIAHDFNNLLGAILGFAQFILDDTGTGTPLHRYASRILKAGQQAKCLIGQILTFSHRREVPRDLIDLGELVADNLSILSALVAPTTTLQSVSGPDGHRVSADRAEMVQVLVNLVVNANEALEGKPGTVTITVGDSGALAPPSAPPFAEHGGTQTAASTLWTDADGRHHAALGWPNPDHRYRMLSVCDTGCGMSAETVENIFSPFFTTKGKKGGTGLGLAVVQNIVHHHQGAVLVDTAPGRGSSFSLFLPEVDADAGPCLEEPPPPPAAAHQGSILLVENSDHFGDMLMTALFRLGYEIATCSDSTEALGFINEDPAAWDLVITDQIMPSLSGTELVSAIKASHPGLPCIICTAYPGDLTEAAARQAGADGFVAKPLDLGRFSLMVKDLIGERPR
ncbi:MAG: CHASE domain-containing protein [Bacteroidota bacterium]